MWTAHNSLTEALNDLTATDRSRRDARRLRMMEAVHIVAGQVTATQYKEPSAEISRRMNSS